MRKSKKFAVRTVNKNHKLVIIQAKTDQGFQDLLKQIGDIKDLAKNTGKTFLFFNKDFKLIIK